MLQRERLRPSPQIVRRHDATPAATYSSPRLLESSLFLGAPAKPKKTQVYATQRVLGIRLYAWIKAPFRSSVQVCDAILS